MKKNRYIGSAPVGSAFVMTRHCRLIVSVIFIMVTTLSQRQVLCETLIVPSSSTDETIAVFDEAEADFEATEAGFDDNSVSTQAVEGNVPGRLFPFASPDPARLSHADNYTAPVFFPDRQPRMVTGIRYTWMIPLLLIVCMVPLIVRQGRRSSRKKTESVKPGRLEAVRGPALIRKLSLLSLVSSIVVFSASTGQAIVYSPVKDAVTSVLGKGEKIFQANITITPEARAYLKKELNWSPDQKTCKVYYSKAVDGMPRRYAFVLSDRLALCGGLHKYCVAVNADGTVYDVGILELTCDRSYCINTRAFLGQFKGFDTHNHAQKAGAYDSMSGATLSADLTRDIVQRALGLMTIMNGQFHG